MSITSKPTLTSLQLQSPQTTDATLPVVETFHSLQGEGVHGGRSAFFIRLAGCSVGCQWCDTKVSWPQFNHPREPISSLVQAVREARRAGAGFVVITGGEPLHHDLTDLCCQLEIEGLPLHLETSGVDSITGRFAWICLSPKRHHPPRSENLQCCHELKVVVHEPDDLSFALSMAAAATKAGNRPTLLLQPGWQSTAGQRLCLDFVRSNPGWQLSLQCHKWLGIR